MSAQKKRKKSKWNKFFQKNKKTIIGIISILLVVLCTAFPEIPAKFEELTGIDLGFDLDETGAPVALGKFDVNQIPKYSGDPYVVVNNNVPYFTEDELTDESYEFYSELDELGRCGAAFANISKDMMPTEERESICDIIQRSAEECGLSEEIDDVTEEWRDW